MSTVEPVDADEVAARRPTSRWQRLPIGARVAIIVIGVVIGVNVLARFVSDSTGGDSSPGGKESSSYATQSNGLAAYADLLGREGHPIVRLRGTLESTPPDPATTVVVLDPDTLSRDDAGVLLNFVVNGGHLVIGGASPRYDASLRDRPPTWLDSGPTRWTDVAPSLAPIARVVSAGDGSFDALGSTSALVGERDAALVTTATVGQGTIDFVADASFLQNRLLATADNAALGVALAGEPGRTVVFAEGVHGYGPSRGLSAIPNDWKLALIGLAIAGLVLMWARGRRLGPPEAVTRPLPPPRAAYVDAVGATLARTKQPDVALQIVAERVGTPINAPMSDASVLALGRALSRLVTSTEGKGQ